MAPEVGITFSESLCDGCYESPAGIGMYWGTSELSWSPVDVQKSNTKIFESVSELKEYLQSTFSLKEAVSYLEGVVSSLNQSISVLSVMGINTEKLENAKASVENLIKEFKEAASDNNNRGTGDN